MELEPGSEWDDLLEEMASPVLLQLSLGRGIWAENEPKAHSQPYEDDVAGGLTGSAKSLLHWGLCLWFLVLCPSEISSRALESSDFR